MLFVELLGLLEIVQHAVNLLALLHLVLLDSISYLICGLILARLELLATLVHLSLQRLIIIVQKRCLTLIELCGLF